MWNTACRKFEGIIVWYVLLKDSYKFFKGCLPQILLSPLLNTLFHTNKALINLKHTPAWKFIAKCKCTYDSCRRNVLNQLFYERHLVNNEREMARGECPKLYLKGGPKNKYTSGRDSSHTTFTVSPSCLKI